MYILGLNLSHDRSACLLKDGRIVVAVAEERLDGVKKSTLLARVGKKHLVGRIPPLRAIAYCLDVEGIGIDDLDLVVADNAVEPVNLASLRSVLPIRDKSKIRALPHPSHHLAHAYSAFFCSPFAESAVLVADVFGSATDNGTETESGFHARENDISPVFKNFQKPYSPELPEAQISYGLTYIYNFVSLALCFTHDGDKPKKGGVVAEAGKTMGLASYGRPMKDQSGIVKVIGDRVDTSGFAQWALEHRIARITDGELVPIARSSKAKLTRTHMNLAYAAQSGFERGMVSLANRLHALTGSTNLCIAGGAGLNSIANKKILDETPFENIFIQPASTDDGTAIGCAFYGWHVLAGQDSLSPMRHVYLGRSYSGDEISESLERHNLPDGALPTIELLRETARHVADGKIVGWYQGGSEFGPRALGHRSIVADPRPADMQDLLNERIKFRESFRPFAPSVLLEHATDYFDLSCPSPYMLLVAQATAARASEIPAVVHVDGTARVQTVTREENGLYYDLVEEFYRLTGVPVVLNTSFNVRGMPIVETPDDAIEMFLDTPMDVLVLDHHLIVKDDRETMAALALHLAAADRLGEAAELSRRALDLYPDDGRFWEHVATDFYKREAYAEAIEAAEAARRLGAGEDGVAMHVLLGESYLKSGQYAQAVPELEAAGAIDVDDYGISFALASCYGELGQAERRRDALDEGFRRLGLRRRGF